MKRWAMVPPGMNDIPEEQKLRRTEVYRELRARERWIELIRVYREHIKASLPPAEARKDD